METPDSTSSRFSFSRRVLKGFALLLMGGGALLLLHLILISSDSKLIALAVFFLGTGEMIHRKLTKPLKVVICPTVFVYDTATKEEELPRDDPRS